MMKVLMIGNSHVGKTTYMAALYQFMADDENICIRAKNNEDHKTLRRFGEELFTQGIYPDKTALKSDYTFSLDIKSKGEEDFHFFDFQWMDYPGGAIYQPTTEPIPNELAEKLDSAEALVVFLDITQLNSQSMMRQWMRIKQFMLKFAGRAREGNPLCLTVILTKFDMEVDFELGESKVWNNLIETLASFGENQHLLGMLATSAINKNSTGNVFFPFIRSMFMGIIQEIDRQIGIINNRSWWEHLKYAFIDDLTTNRLNLLQAYLNHLVEACRENNGIDKGGYILF